MKSKKLPFLLVIVVVGLLMLLKASGGADKDFALFRKNKLSLPIKHETDYLAGALGADALHSPEAVVKNGFEFAGLPTDYRLAKNCFFDLDQDGTFEKYLLEDGRLKVALGSGTWESPANWWVDDFFLGDANNDGLLELNLLVWKAGNFGPSKPFWVKEADRSVKNHLFILKIEKGSFKAVWQSSNLDRPIYRATLADLDGDGKNELIVIEGSYAAPGEKQLTIWRWNGWGFSRVEGPGE